MQNAIRISVIVPVFNSENTLFDSLGNLAYQSICRDNLNAMEIILVNDHSSDHSLQVIRKFQNQFREQTRVIDLPENHGPGGARNFGMEAAQGEYIGFMDSDDLIDTGMYEKLYRAATSGKIRYDIADCGIAIGKSGINFLYTHPDTWGVLNDAARGKLISAPGYSVTRIYRRELLNQYHIRFREHAIMEDHDFLSEVFAHAQSVTGVKEILYEYRDVEGSASKKNFGTIYFDAAIDTIYAIYHKLSGLSNYEGLRDGAEFAYLDLIWRTLQETDIALTEGRISQDDASRRYRRLHAIRMETVQGNIEKNQYVQERMTENIIERVLNS